MESAAVTDPNQEPKPASPSLAELKLGDISVEDMKDIIKKLDRVDFFETLTQEMTGKIKNIAQELIDFRKDLQKKIEPGIIEMASKDIPEASHQLTEINETLESSTMKIMDINDEQMDLSRRQLESLKSQVEAASDLNQASEIVNQQMEALERINNLSLSMMEPLSFQDLVGQRIQRIIKLVETMEVRIEDLIISFGIKIQKYKEDPSRTYEDLRKEEEDFRSELRGPQREGEGLGQGDIDALLASL